MNNSKTKKEGKLRIGELRVYRNYSIPQMVVDFFSLIILVVIYQCTATFGEEMDYIASFVQNADGQGTALPQWQWNYIWLGIAVAVVILSLLMTYLPRRMPKKYIVNEENKQKYSDIIITAITCLRIPVLITLFEVMYIHQCMISYRDVSFSLLIPLDIVLALIIIFFTRHRIIAVQPPKEEKSHEIIEG